MKNNNLTKIIVYDLINWHKTQLILLLITIVSAISLVTIIHKTRLLTKEIKLMNSITKNIEQEWSYLILEKHLLLSHHRMENIAIKKLNMIHIPTEKEHILINVDH